MAETVRHRQQKQTRRGPSPGRQPQIVPSWQRRTMQRRRTFPGIGLIASTFGLDHEAANHCLHYLGRVDGFDEDEAESKGHNGAVVLGRLLAAERHPLEALELTHKLLDAGTSPIERLRKECRPSLGRWNVGRVLADDLTGITGQMLRSRAAERLALAS